MVATNGIYSALTLASDSKAGCQGWQKCLVGWLWLRSLLSFLVHFLHSLSSSLFNLSHREEGSAKQNIYYDDKMYATPPRDILILFYF